MIRAVLDTNVWISGFLWKGTARHLLELAWARRYTPLTTHAILHEMSVVLAADFEVPPERVLEIQRSIIAISELVTIPSLMPYPVRDPKDLPIIACALEGRADFLVSGDRDLLILRRIHRIPVLTIRQFLQKLAAA